MGQHYSKKMLRKLRNDIPVDFVIADILKQPNKISDGYFRQTNLGRRFFWDKGGQIMGGLAISTPEEYIIGAIPLIKRDSYESLSNKVYSTAIKIGNKDQKVHLKKEVEKQKIRITGTLCSVQLRSRNDDTFQKLFHIYFSFNNTSDIHREKKPSSI